MTQSSASSESEILQKLGFENQIDNRTIYASILNGLRINFSVIPILIEIISYIQVCSIGFYCTIPGILSESSYTHFVHSFFETALDLSTLFSNKDGRDKCHTYLIIFYSLILIIWVFLYLIFIIQYKITQSYKPIIVNLIYYVGYYAVTIFSLPMGTSFGFFLRNLFIDVSSAEELPIFFSVVLILSFIYVNNFMIKVIHSSPNVNSNDPLCLWPQNYYPLLYRQLLGFILSILLELFRGNGKITENIGYGLALLSGIIGLYLLWTDVQNVFPNGQIILSTEYIILIVASLLSLIHYYQKINSLYYLLIFIVLVVGIGVGLSYLNFYKTKRVIDLLYLPITDAVEHITSPEQCIYYMKRGLIYKVPCIQNFRLLNWSVSVWPTNKKLLLFVSYILYLFHMPYMEILDLISRAINISPLDEYERLLYFQLFNRLPIHEQLLKKKLNGIRRLYEIPISSLKNFWRAVLAHQWDEAVLKSISFQKDTDRISLIFSNIIFEHPFSECITREFAQYTIQIQGNYALAHLIEKELEARIAYIQMITNENQEPNNKLNSYDSGSMKFSNLSSLNSSIFYSDFSDIPEGFDKSQGEIQSAVNARPIFWPTNFFISTVIMSFISLAVVISSYTVAHIESTRLDNQINFASRIHQFAQTFTQILYASIEFTTLGKNASQTVSGTEKDEFTQRNNLINFTHNFGEILISAFSYHSSLPKSSLEFWVKKEVTSYVFFPIEEEIRNLTIMEAMRIYQVKSQTIAFSPLDYLGTIEKPCSEILQITYLYPTVSEALNIMMQTVADISGEEIDDNRLKVIISVSVCMGVSLIALIILAPIVISGIIKEYDFLIGLYSTIPVQNVINNIQKKIVIGQAPQQPAQRDNDGHKDDELLLLKKLEQSQSKKKIKLPLRLYHVGSMVAVFLCAFLITPLPFVMIIISYLEHVKESHFTLNGLQLSSEMITSFGMLSLFGFRLVSGFPSFLPRLYEADQFLNAADLMLEKYSELYFGGSDTFPKGLITRKESEKVRLIHDIDENCRQLIGYGNIHHNCVQTHDEIFLLYGLCQRIIELEKSANSGNNGDQNLIFKNGIESRVWRLFYPVASELLEISIEMFYEVFNNSSVYQCAKNKLLSILSLVLGIFFFFLTIFISKVYTKQVLAKSFKSILKPIVIMNPSDVVESPFLLRFLQGDFDNSNRNSTFLKNNNNSAKSKSGKNSITTFNGVTLIDFINEGVLVMTVDGTIIASNKKYHEMFCNAPEEVLGANVHSIFIQALNPLRNELNEIKNGKRIEQNLSMNASLYAEDGKELQVNVSLVFSNQEQQLSQHGGKSVICAFIFTDESEILKTQNKLNQEKENVESILNSFLPHNLVSSCMNGSENISFEVDKGCILYSSLIFPVSVTNVANLKLSMNVLNLVFGEFDSELTKFSSLTKLRTVDHNYICVGGLFKEDGNIEKAVKEIVSLALKMRDLIFKGILIDETPVKIKIGVYTGGPLVCGVIGKDSPAFEVFSSALSIAEELGKSAPENSIHISQSTIDYIYSIGLDMDENPNSSIIEGSTWIIK
ncbi:hypothetical protein M9Y10_009781 [Tritrichomonas musculus]|uniref:Guanylate cyclase domain-containing protein n=1 Tax=Tritrichomonas musculus TaxID=1915356 RepID=A0ABR2IR11_9EUKA